MYEIDHLLLNITLSFTLFDTCSQVNDYTIPPFKIFYCCSAAHSDFKIRDIFIASDLFLQKACYFGIGSTKKWETT